GHIPLVVAVGTMLGKMMAESGGAGQIARTMIRGLAERNVHWAMVSLAFLVGFAVLFGVRFVLLLRLAANGARRTGTSILFVGLPMVAGLSVVHGLVPPHPAAMIAVGEYQANVGRTIFYALMVGIPTAIIAGPIFAKWIAPKIQLPAHNPLEEQFI